MRPYLLAAASLLVLTAPYAAIAQESPPVETTADQDRLEADVRYLADDALEGREAGSVGYALAAGYVAGQFAAIGLEQGGPDGTYFQTVPMNGSRSLQSDGAGVTITGANGEALFADSEVGVDYLVFPKRGMEASDAEGELAFVSFGFAADGYEQDDFADIDLTGKIAVIIGGAPPSLNSEERAHFGATVGERLSERGAVGSVQLKTPQSEQRFTFEFARNFVANATFMGWVDPDGVPHTSAPNIQARTMLSPGMSAALFDGQPVSWDDIVEHQEGERGALMPFDMGMTMKIAGRAHETPVTSRNVVGILPGTDPSVADEYIVVTAHLDHTGITPTEEEGDDEINNGAMDNATGIASMLEVARILKADPPRRPVMFVALTAEEKGLVGSDYIARNSTVTDGEAVANINLDMPILTYDFTDVIAFGAERSTLLPVVEAAAAAQGIALSEDPMPQQGLFTRSDQYSYVKQGVPAIFLVTGWANGGQAAQMEFLANHYHKPSDEIGLVRFDQLQKFTQVNLAITRNVANMAVRPVWKAGDFFGTTFDGPMVQVATEDAAE